MTHDIPADVRVGCKSVSLDQATEWVASYVDVAANRVAKKPYAYPTYDGYFAGGGTNELTDGDMLAPGLLNVPVGIRAFYGLQRVRSQLQRALNAIPVDLPLAGATDDQVWNLTSDVYRVLDQDRPRGVRETLLSKVLHRKRPEFLILHDKQVRASYVGTDKPVPGARRLSYADYMTAVSVAVAEDLRTQQTAWSHLAAVAATSDGPSLTPVRLLDIIAWNAGK